MNRAGDRSDPARRRSDPGQPDRSDPNPGQLDLRLLPIALAVWLGTLGGLLGGVRETLAVAAVAATVAVPAFWRAVRSECGERGRYRAVRPLPDTAARPVVRFGAALATVWGSRSVLAVVLVAGTGSAVGAIAEVHRSANPVAVLAAAHRTAPVSAVIGSVPRPLGGAGPPGAVLVRVRVTGLPDGASARAGRPSRDGLDAPVTVLAEASWARLRPGTRVAATLRLAPRRRMGPDTASAVVRGPPRVLAGPTGIRRITGQVRAGLEHVSAPLGQPASGLLPAIVHGDTSRVPPAVAEQFRVSGLAHLEAVSGANVAIVVIAVSGIAISLGAGRRTTAVIGTAAVVAFAVLSDVSPPVVRASATAVLVLFGGRAAPGRGPALLATAVTVLLLVDPWLAVDVGFALSVSATAGILAAAPRFTAALGCWLPRPLAQAAGIAVAAQTACQPLLTAISAQVGLVAPFTNIAAEPAVATLAGLAAAVLAALPGPAPIGALLGTGATGAAQLGGSACRWLATVARTGADAPGATVGWSATPAGLAVAVAVSAVVLGFGPVLLRRRRPTLVVSAVIVGMLIGPVVAW